MRHAITLLGAALLAGAGGCAFDDGQGFARLSVRLGARFDRDPGRLDGAWYKTDNSYALELSRMRLTVRAVELLGPSAATTTGGGEGCKIDPANPPEGCSLCHGGHCHCGDALLSYEELEAQICGAAGGASAPALLARLAVGEARDLLGADASVSLTGCEPSCELGRGSAEGLRVVVDRLEIAGKVKDPSALGRLGGETLDLAVDLELAGATLTADLDPVQLLERDQPYPLDLAVELALPATLLDGIDWADLERTDKRIDVDASGNTQAGERLLSAAAAAGLDVTVTRSNDE